MHHNSHTRYSAYPVLLADSAGVLEVASPGEAEGAALEVSVGEHVGETEVVVIFLWIVIILSIHNIYSKIIHLKKFPGTFRLRNFLGTGNLDLLMLHASEPLFS